MTRETRDLILFQLCAVAALAPWLVVLRQLARMLS
jgi:hypothetical protein